MNRFTNKRVIAPNICQKLIAVKPFTHEVNSRVLEDFNVQVKGVNNSNLTSDSDFILSFVGLQLLDPTKRQGFEN